MRTWSRVESPSPPTSCGISAFISPSSQACSQISLGKVPCSSSFPATGMIFSRVNLRAVSTRRCCSSVSAKSIGLFSCESGGTLLQEGLHAFAAVLSVEQQRERLRLLAVCGAQGHVIAALHQPLRAGDGERALGGDLLRERAAMLEQLLLREDGIDEADLVGALRVYPVA